MPNLSRSQLSNQYHHSLKWPLLILCSLQKRLRSLERLWEGSLVLFFIFFGEEKKEARGGGGGFSWKLFLLSAVLKEVQSRRRRALSAERRRLFLTCARVRPGLFVCNCAATARGPCETSLGLIWAVFYYDWLKGRWSIVAHDKWIWRKEREGHKRKVGERKKRV